MEPALIISIISIVLTVVFSTWNIFLARDNH